MPGAVIFKDTFTRTVTDSWGSSDTGQAWEILVGAAADFDVDGDQGTITLPDNTEHQISFPGNYTSVRGVWTLQASAVATGTAGYTCTIQLRRLDSINYLAVQAEFLTSGNVNLAIYKVVAGSVTQLQAVSKGAYSANQDWDVKWYLSGDILKAKLWASAATEPTAWDVSGTQSDLSSAGRVALRTKREVGNTNAGLVVRYNFFEVSTLLSTVQILPQFLDDYEFKFGHDGLLLNGELSHATVGNPIWDIQKVTGLDLPDIKSSDKEFDGIDGGVLEANNISMRTVRLEGVLYAHQDDDLEVYLDQLKTNFSPVPRVSSAEVFDPNERPFFIKPPGAAERFVFAKPVGLSYEWGSGRRFNSTSFQIILQSQIPTFFSPELHKVTGSMTGSLSTPTSIAVYNAGNYHGYAVVRLLDLVHTLPITIRLAHVESGQELEILLGTPLLAGRPLEINMRQRTVFVIDDPAVNIRDQVVDEEWWRLAPGVNTIQASNDRDVGTVEILWRDEWF